MLWVSEKLTQNFKTLFSPKVQLFPPWLLRIVPHWKIIFNNFSSYQFLIKFRFSHERRRLGYSMSPRLFVSVEGKGCETLDVLSRVLINVHFAPSQPGVDSNTCELISFSLNNEPITYRMYVGHSSSLSTLNLRATSSLSIKSTLATWTRPLSLKGRNWQDCLTGWHWPTCGQQFPRQLHGHYSLHSWSWSSNDKKVRSADRLSPRCCQLRRLQHNEPVEGVFLGWGAISPILEVVVGELHCGNFVVWTNPSEHHGGIGKFS